MNRLAHKWLAHPAEKLVFAATVTTALLLTPASARAGTEFPEFRGVPEGLGLRSLTMDMDLDCAWSWLGLVVLVAALVVTDRLIGDKRKD